MAKYTTKVHCINFNSHDEVRNFFLDLKNSGAKVVAFDYKKPNFNTFAIMTKARVKETKK